MTDRRVAFAGAVPACFTSAEQYRDWVIKARMAPPPPGLSVCADCTKPFQMHMLRQCRCENGHVKFDSNGDPIPPPEQSK
jgi:hypothetical protein